jgi:hypothetical protein
LRSFAAGLKRDHAAVVNGLTLPYSSGAVEGNVNRIKTLKRQICTAAPASICSASGSYSRPETSLHTGLELDHRMRPQPDLASKLAAPMGWDACPLWPPTRPGRSRTRVVPHKLNVGALTLPAAPSRHDLKPPSRGLIEADVLDIYLIPHPTWHTLCRSAAKRVGCNPDRLGWHERHRSTDS